MASGGRRIDRPATADTGVISLSAVPAEILRSSPHLLRIVTKASEREVAGIAQKSPDLTGTVTVIEREIVER